MWRYLAGFGSVLLLLIAGTLLWTSLAQSKSDMPAAPSESAGPLGTTDVTAPLQASDRTREEKRFARFDKDKNGAVSSEEYLLSRRKAYARLDLNGDGQLSFDEYAVKTVKKFATADRDRSAALTPAEFLTTRAVRKTSSRKECASPLRVPAATESADDEA